MKKLLSIFLLLFFTYYANAQVQGKASLGYFVSEMNAVLVTRCSTMPEKIKREANAGNHQMVEALKDMMISTCECVPKKLNNILISTPAAKLNKQITQSQLELILSPLVEQCSVAQFKKVYAENCQERLIPKTKKSPLKYCSCMKKATESMLDSEIVQVGLESTDYSSKKILSKQKGTPEPEMPNSIRGFAAIEKSCSLEN